MENQEYYKLWDESNTQIPKKTVQELSELLISREYQDESTLSLAKEAILSTINYVKWSTESLTVFQVDSDTLKTLPANAEIWMEASVIYKNLLLELLNKNSK